MRESKTKSIEGQGRTITILSEKLCSIGLGGSLDALDTKVG